MAVPWNSSHGRCRKKFVTDVVSRFALLDVHWLIHLIYIQGMTVAKRGLSHRWQIYILICLRISVIKPRCPNRWQNVFSILSLSIAEWSCRRTWSVKIWCAVSRATFKLVPWWNTAWNTAWGAADAEIKVGTLISSSEVPRCREQRGIEGSYFKRLE